MLAIAGCGTEQIGQPAADSAALSSRATSEPAGMPPPVAVDAEGPPETDEGTGPGSGGDRYDEIVENPFLRVVAQPLSTFSIDVDTASYSKVRQFLLQHNRLPRPDAVRIEELVNYFDYDYAGPSPEKSEPFTTHVAVSSCPWNEEHRLARIAIKGRPMQLDQRPPSNLVFLIDSSGSMDSPNRLPLLKRGLRLMLEQLDGQDRVAVVAYAGSAGLVLDSTPGDQQATILAAIDRLDAGGSTNGGAGLELAYNVARENLVEGGTNRVLLCTDGDFNVGRTGTDQMLDTVEMQSKAGVELTVLGFGMGNFNDAMLEQISGRGNGNYAFIDTYNEARKVLVQQLSGTLVTIAKDVKIQVEFNPHAVAAYRLIGYENRVLESQDFNDDTKDAGEIGAGHSVTALYEIVPAGAATVAELPETDPLKYQTPAEPSLAAASGELMTVKLRYKQPGQEQSILQQWAVDDSGRAFSETDTDFQFAAAVAGFGMLLRDSRYAGDWTLDAIEEVAQSALGDDPWGFRQEFVEMVAAAASLRRGTRTD
ncbi:vWA domain-containing protein [Roseimaritima sediminicola]|uniref:vWA domain-containing protein n=1 Tax=Roseimaritima sediminicola TaxID=2662066 RepID=UPI00192A65F9|nr:VWA domain-containing protein [Roseimaritima sediminicola]